MVIIFWSPRNHDKYVCRKRQSKTKYSNSVIKKLNKWRSFLYKMFRLDKYHFIISSIWSLLKKFKHSLPSISWVHTEEEEDKMMLTAVGRKGDLLDYFQNLSYCNCCSWIKTNVLRLFSWHSFQRFTFISQREAAELWMILKSLHTDWMWGNES